MLSSSSDSGFLTSPSSFPLSPSSSLGDYVNWENCRVTEISVTGLLPRPLALQESQKFAETCGYRISKIGKGGSKFSKTLGQRYWPTPPYDKFRNSALFFYCRDPLVPSLVELLPPLPPWLLLGCILEKSHEEVSEVKIKQLKVWGESITHKNDE